MNEFVFRINEAFGASIGIALAAALVWGILSVLLSPCHLGTIPLVVGIVGSNAVKDVRRSGTVISFSFAAGMLGAIAVLGAITAAAGHALSGYGTATKYGIAVVLAVAGLNLLGLVPLPLPSLALRPGSRRGAWAAAVLGFVFGVGLSPCTFAFLAPIVGLTFGAAATDPLRGAALLLVFGVGHCAVIGLAGSSTDLVQRYLDWNEGSRALVVLKSVCGALVLVAAGVLVYTA